MKSDENGSSPGRGRTVVIALGVWVLGAGVLGGSWAVARVESSLERSANELAIVEQAQSQGAKIEWSGRTANLDPGSLNAQATDELMAALTGLDGVADVKLAGMTDTEVAVATVSSTTVPSTTVQATTMPATTVGTEPPTTVPPTTVPPSTEAAPTTVVPPENQGAAKLEMLLDNRSIEFIFSTAVPTPETEVLLDELHDLLQANPTLALHITGHTDPVGNETANQLLSEARAQSIANHLIIRGIDANRMTTAGKGSTEPIADNSTLVGKQQNRRVVIEAALGGST